MGMDITNNKINLQINEFLANIYNLRFYIYDFSTLNFGKLHNFIPVNFLTILLCPYLMAREYSELLFFFFSTQTTLIYIIFFFLYLLIVILSYKLLISLFLTRDLDSFKNIFKLNKELKKIGLY